MVSKVSSFRTARVLGQGASPMLMISSVLFVLIIFFYTFAIGSYFQVEISSLENRVNHHKPFLNYVFGKYLDDIVIVSATASWLALSLLRRAKIFIPLIYLGFTAAAAALGSAAFEIMILFSFPVVVFLLVCNRFAKEKILHFSRELNRNYLAILASALAAFSLIVSAAPLFSTHSNQGQVNDYAYDIFLLFGSFTPFLIFFLFTGSSARLLIGRTLDKILRTEPTVSEPEKKSRNPIPYLLLVMLLSVALSLIPHYPTINVDNQEVSSDSGDYVMMLRHMTNSTDSAEFFHQTFVTVQGGDRPLFLLFWYGIAKIVPASPSFVSDHLSVILAPAMVLSIFLLTRELTSNYKVSLFAAFITAASFQTLVGVYAGFYANMFALVIGYLSLAVLIRFLKKSGRANFVAYIVLMVLLVLSHVYTWTIITLVTGIFLVLIYKFNSYERRRIALLSLVVLLSIAIDVSRTILTQGHGGISQDTALASTGAGLPLIFLSWANLTDSILVYGGGQFANFIVLGLGLYWLVRSNLRQPSNMLLAIFLSIGIIPLLFGSELIQFRVFYNIPFQIPAAIALVYLGRKTNRLMILPVCIWLVAVSLRMVTNFYYISPS